MTTNIDICRINWSLHKPLINENTLQETKGPSTYPERDPSCIICLDEIDEQATTLTHSKCSHTAHKTCFKQWLDQEEDPNETAQCPMCRQAYLQHDQISNYCNQKTTAAMKEICSIIIDVYPLMEDEEFVKSLDTISHALSKETNLICKIPQNEDLEEFLVDVLYDYPTVVIEIEDELVEALSVTMKTIKGRAEDMMISGKHWEEVKALIDNESESAKANLRHVPGNFKSDVATRKANIQKAIGTYFVKRVCAPHVADTKRRDKLDTAISKNTEFFRDRHLLRMTKHREVAELMARAQHGKEQLDYHARTGMWTQNLPLLHHDISLSSWTK